MLKYKDAGFEVRAKNGSQIHYRGPKAAAEVWARVFDADIFDLRTDTRISG